MWERKTGNNGVLAITNITERLTPTRGAKQPAFKTEKANIFNSDMETDLSC